MSLKLKKVLRVISKIVLILVGICIFLYFGFVTFVSIFFDPHDVRLTNVTDSSMTISWITNYPMKGIVYYKDSDSFLPGPLSWIGSGKAYDDRDVADAQERCVEEYNKEHEASEDFVVDTSDYDCVDVEVKEYGGYYAHHVTLKNLDSNKMYYFRIGDGYFNWKKDIDSSATFYTLDSEVKAPAPIYGKIVNEAGEYIDDSVVYIKFTNEYIGKESMYYSSATNENGGWYLDGNNIRTIEGEPMLVEDGQDMITVYAQYQNYTLSEENKWVYGNTDIGYPDIVVSDDWEKDLSMRERGTELVYRSYAGTLDDYVYNYNTYIATDKNNDGKKDYVKDSTEIKYDSAKELATAIVAASKKESVEEVEEEEVTYQNVANAQTLLDNAKKVEEAKAAEKQATIREEDKKASNNKEDCTYDKRSDVSVCSVGELFENRYAFGAGYIQNELLSRIEREKNAGGKGINIAVDGKEKLIKTNLQLIEALGYCGNAMACASNYNLLESEKGYAIKTDQLICEDDKNPTNCLFKKDGTRIGTVSDISYNPDTKVVTFTNASVDPVPDEVGDDTKPYALIFNRSKINEDFSLSLSNTESANIRALFSQKAINSINTACIDKKDCTVCVGISSGTEGCDKVISTSEIEINSFVEYITENIGSYRDDGLSGIQKFLDFCISSMDHQIGETFSDDKYSSHDFFDIIVGNDGTLDIVIWEKNDMNQKVTINDNDEVKINAYIERLLGLSAESDNKIKFSDLEKGVEEYNKLRSNISTLNIKITEIQNTKTGEKSSEDEKTYEYESADREFTVKIESLGNGKFKIIKEGNIGPENMINSEDLPEEIKKTLEDKIDKFGYILISDVENYISSNSGEVEDSNIEYTYFNDQGGGVRIYTNENGELELNLEGTVDEIIVEDEEIRKKLGLNSKIVSYSDLLKAIDEYNKKIEESSMLLEDTDTNVLSQLSTLLQSILTNPLLSTVAYAAGEDESDNNVLGATSTSNSGYIYYLPEYGIYDMEVGGLTKTERVDGVDNDLQIFYIEMNGKDGLQLPVDPNNPQVGEDFVLQSDSLEIKYKEVAEPNPLNIKKGINIISFDYIPVLNTDNSSKASALLEWFAKKNVDVDHISYFEGGRWKGIGYVDGETIGNDFTIIPGKGYLLYSEEDKTVNIPGYDITQSIPVPLYSGWNLIGVHGYTKAYTAESLLESINSIDGLTADNVSWWPTSEGKYEGLQITDGEVYGLDFAISKLNGYFVRISKFEPKDQSCGSLIWHPSGKLNGKCGNSKTVN